MIMGASCQSVRANGRDIDVEIFTPSIGVGPWSGVLLLHELFGLTANVRSDARHLAQSGYLVLAPNLYTDSMSRYCMKMFFTKDALANRDGSGPTQEIHHCLDMLKKHPSCNGKLGMVGMWLTGGFVLQMACRDDMLAPVVYHHSNGLIDGGLPKSQHAHVKHTIQGHFAEGDRICPKSRVNTLKKALGDKLEVNYYDNIGHGIRSAFRYTPQSDEAWNRTLEFFSQHL